MARRLQPEEENARQHRIDLLAKMQAEGTATKSDIRLLQFELQAQAEFEEFERLYKEEHKDKLKAVQTKVIRYGKAKTQ